MIPTPPASMHPSDTAEFMAALKEVARTRYWGEPPPDPDWREQVIIYAQSATDETCIKEFRLRSTRYVKNTKGEWVLILLVGSALYGENTLRIESVRFERSETLKRIDEYEKRAAVLDARYDLDYGPSTGRRSEG